MTNRLMDEKSPYLRQHAENPVNWYAWGPEAFDTAKAEDKPIFLSIGYATCHWCHVMEEESFSDDEVAELLNEHFVAIKVDREERPDIDNVYMTACQAMTGQGGWPLTILTDGEGKPFFAGTYFPKTSQLQQPGIINILSHYQDLWENQRDQIVTAAQTFTEALAGEAAGAGSGDQVDINTLELAYDQHLGTFDPTWAGFGQAPKFPSPHRLSFLLRWNNRKPEPEAVSMVEKTLDAMAKGGIYDQIGFGFHRYSVDEFWHIPHFEKMLYDQALLAATYIEAFQVTGHDRYAETAHEIFTYVLKEMTSPDFGFYSAQDADSEGKEGTFYAWTHDEIINVLGQEMGGLFAEYYDAHKEGNFENGRNVLRRPYNDKDFAAKHGLNPDEFKAIKEDARRALLEHREKRERPFKDTKIITAWNGLMISALAKGWQALDDRTYLVAAETAADFILKNMTDDQGRVKRRYMEGSVDHNGFLDDYAFLVMGLLDLYEAGFDLKYLEKAVLINKAMLELFWDDEGSGFFSSGKENEQLIIRSKELYDGALPSGNSAACLNLVRLSRMTGDTSWEEKADQLIKAFSGQVSAQPMAYTHFLAGLDFAMGPAYEVVIAGDQASAETKKMISAVHKTYCPNKVFLVKQNHEGPRLAGIAPYTESMPAPNGKSLAYVCQDFACQAPIDNEEDLKAVLSGLVKP